MSVYTKPGADVFAPQDNAGNPRAVSNGDAQVWATEVERGIAAAAVITFVNGGWVTATPYVENQALTHNDVVYRCIADHTSGSTTEPGVGGSWQTVWEVMIGAIALEDGSVENAKLSNMDTARIKGRTTSGSGAPEDLTAEQVKTILSLDQVDNTPDTDKPISTAVGEALDAIDAAGSKGFMIQLTVTARVGDAYEASISAEFVHLSEVAGTLYVFRAGDASNTGPVTLKIGAGAALPIVNIDDLPLVAGELVAFRWYILRRASTNFKIVASAPAARYLAPGIVRLASQDEMFAGESEAAAVPKTTLPLVRPLAEAHILETDNPLPLEFGGDVYPLVTNETGRVLLGVDVQTGEIVGGGLGGGISGAGVSESALMAYLDVDDLHAVGLDDQVVADLSGLDVKAVESGNSLHVRALVDRPMKGSYSVVGAGPARPSLLIPDNARSLYVFIGIGQSLMVGAEAAPTLISTTPVLADDVLMFNAGSNSDVRMGLATVGGTNPVLDAASLVGFIPLVARVGQGAGNRGETPMEAFATSLSLVSREIGVQFRSLSYTAAQGGTNYAGLKKGTQIYANMLTALSKAKTLAESQGWSLIVAGVLHKHGESDMGNASYYDNLIEWQADIDTDVKSITGQALDVNVFMAQPSSFTSATPHPVQAMVDAHNNSPFHWLTGPDYPFGDEYFSDNVHMTGPGYFHIGEQMAIAYRELMWGRGHKLTQMTAAERSGTTVTLTWDVPVPPLVFDTTTLSERDVKGLRYTDSEGDVTISSATITNDGAGTGVGIITLTLDSVPSGTGETVHYAMSPMLTSPSLNRARGNIRDSRAEESRHDSRQLHGWAPHHSLSVVIV